MNIEEELQLLKQRNKKVEAEKAWETSYFRIITITLITYVLAALVMLSIGITNYLQSALIPALGYFLSTRSLPVIKNWWIAHNFKSK